MSTEADQTLHASQVRDAWVFGVLVAVISILKPLKKSLLLGSYDSSSLTLWGFQLGASEVELLAKSIGVLLALVAVGAIGIFSRSRTINLSVSFQLLFAASLVSCLAVGLNNKMGVWAFFLVVDLFSIVVVALFFFADAVRRLTVRFSASIGSIGLGGVIGGTLGSAAVAFGVNLSPAWWTFLCAGVLFFALGVGLRTA